VTTYDTTSALVVVDVQNDFADPHGGLFVRGAQRILPIVNANVLAAEAAGAFVVYTQDWHPEVTPHFAKDGGIWPVHCVAGTWGAELHPDLLVLGPVIHKGANGEDGYSGFTMRHPVTSETIPTGLEGLLRERGVERVFVCGLATDYCVNATALDAIELGFETLVLGDAIAAVNLQRGDGRRAIDEMSAAGVEVVAATAASAPAASESASESSTGPSSAS